METVVTAVQMEPRKKRRWQSIHNC